MELWVEGTRKLVKMLPQDVQDVLKKDEADGTTDSQEYLDATQCFYNKHVCSINPWPKHLLESFAAVEADPTVYHTMFGHNEFNCTGTLRTWSCIDKLHNITSPTLFAQCDNCLLLEYSGAWINGPD
ncbi:L-amino acid amidase [Grifola frondosa]|uniref:L-amino acid amidase n=1 Tax=Grifola frondosa TaxID=5627 RepID=A0A1C7MBP7_GRIFR|nr:L-amino acid amidase [Grifola frondosa]